MLTPKPSPAALSGSPTATRSRSWSSVSRQRSASPISTPPESKQAFGSRSKQSLSDLCFQKDARLETQGKDRYGRTIATVYCAGRSANAEQVWQGMAWVFDRYAKPDS